MRFKGKVVIVTGAASGIGKEIALRFSTEGAHIALVDTNEAGLQTLKVQIEEKSSKALAIPTDIGNLQPVDKMVKEVIGTFDKIDILVNCGGIARDAFFKDMSEQSWHEVINVNLNGTFNCSKSVVPHMIAQQSGKIVNISSAGYLGNIGCANYNASKAGILAFTRSLALELGRYGITVNAVAPGFIDTPLSQVYPEKIVEKYIAGLPLKRPGTPEDVAPSVLFLASDDASYITGQTLFVCGGMSLGKAPM